MKTSTEIRFGFWDVTARRDAQMAVNSSQPFARAPDINQEDAVEAPDTATLEHNFWLLDGSKSLLSDNPSSISWGWWSLDMCGADCHFGAAPTLTVAFTQPHSSMGITLTFDEVLPGEVNITWYDLAGAVLDTGVFVPDKMTFCCDKQVENYGKVVITVPSMAVPYRYLRVTHIIFGALEILGGNQLQKATVTEEVNPAALTLPISTLETSFYSSTGRFSLLDMSGAYRLFQQKQPLEVYEQLDAERRFMGVYYLNEAAGTVDNVTQLKCVDALGVLDSVEHKGGIYTDYPIRSLLDDLLVNAGFDYTLDTYFDNEKLTGYLPIGTVRAALQQVVIAIGAVVDTTRGEDIRIYPIPAGTTQYITPARKVIGHSVKLGELVTQVDVTAHSYRMDTEETELSNTRLDRGLHTITFGTPAEVTRVSSGTVLAKGHNYVVIDMGMAGNVTVAGKKYVDDTSVYTVKTDSVSAGERPSIKAVTGATLIDPARAIATAQRIYDYYQLRYTDTGTILPGAEKVAVQTDLSSMGGKSITGSIERMVIDLTGGYLSKITMRGR